MPTRLAARDGAKTRPRMMVTPDTSNKQNSTEEEVRLLEQFGASLPKRFYVSNFTGAMGRVVKNRMPRAFPSLPKLPNASSSIFETARNTTEANDDSGYFPNVGSLWKGMTNWTNSIPSFPSRKSRERIPVKSLEELEFWLKQGVSVHRLDIRGRSQPWRQNEKGELVEALPESQGPDEDRLGRADGRERQLQHPVLRAIWKRVRENSKPGQRKDNFKIALAIEGGGLRGSVTAGMASAIMHLGLGDAFDMVLGSSAGSIIGTYLVARAPPSMTYQFFCNHLTTSREKLNGSTWLDMGRLVDLFTPDSIPRPRRQKKDQIPMMALDYPMKTIMQELLPVNWETFQKNDRHQPMKVVASGLFSKGPVVLGSEEGSFTDLASLCECVKASCMLPGVAGVQPPWLRGSAAVTSPEKLKRGQQEWVEQEMQRSVLFKARDVFLQQLGERVRKKVEAQGDDRAAGVNGISRSGMQRALSDLGIKPTEEELDKIFVAADLNANGQIELDEFNEMILAMLRNSDLEEWFQPMEGIEPMVDALVFEPIPYRSAADYGCTHVLVLRSYPDGKLLPRSLLGLFERLVAPKCLDPFPEVKSHLTSGGHSVVYAEDILKLNSAVARPSEDIDEIQVDDARDVGRQLAAKTSKWLGLPGLVKNEREQARREPYLFAISPLDTDGEVSQLTLNREVLLNGIMQGFARAYDLLVPDECPAGGDQVAADVYLPIHYKFLKQLAKSGNLEKTYKYQRSLFFNLPSLRQDATRGKATPKLSLMGKRVPEAWSEGGEYVMSEGSMFDRNELVVMTGTDGSLRFGVVMGCKDGECILEYGEPDSRDQSPLFRMERVEYVGKIMADMSELKALTVDGPKKTFTGTSMKFVSNLLQRMKKDNDRARVPREDAPRGKEKVGKRGRVARLQNAQAGVQQSRSSGVDGDGI